jgi:hypothetical protein
MRRDATTSKESGPLRGNSHIYEEIMSRTEFYIVMYWIFRLHVKAGIPRRNAGKCVGQFHEVNQLDVEQSIMVDMVSRKCYELLAQPHVTVLLQIGHFGVAKVHVSVDRHSKQLFVGCKSADLLLCGSIASSWISSDYCLNTKWTDFLGSNF